MAQQHSEAGARIYRTAAGLRYILTHKPQKPDEHALVWLKELGTDSLYVTLCKTQDCFRARLSPKPWRINAERPPNAFPRETAQQQAAFRKWLGDYEQKSKSYAVCKFLKTVGNNHVHDDLDSLVREHDRATKAQMDLPLA